MKNFWTKLPKHFIALAPMAGVTDFPFREILCEIGKPDLFFTEFVSTEMIYRRGAVSAPDKKGGMTPPLQLHFSKKEKPIIAQFFGCKPEQFRICAQLAVKLGFDGIDINMGCPDRKVQKQGAGSELIRNPELVRKIIQATIEGCGEKIPVSLKTRLGYDKKDIPRYLEILKDIIAEKKITAITIHGRTVRQGYSGEADWEMIGKFAKEFKKISKNTVVIGNGDVKNVEQEKNLAEKYGVDGVMIGRQVLKNPWVFSGKEDVSLKERIKIALKHTELFEKFHGREANIGAMKKYYKGYFAGIAGDSFPKKRLMESKDVGEVKIILKSQMTNYK